MDSGCGGVPASFSRVLVRTLPRNSLPLSESIRSKRQPAIFSARATRPASAIGLPCLQITSSAQAQEDAMSIAMSCQIGARCPSVVRRRSRVLRGLRSARGTWRGCSARGGEEPSTPPFGETMISPHFFRHKDLPLVCWSRVFRVLASARRQNAREVSISSASSGR